MARTEAQKRAKRKYEATRTKALTMRFNKKIDADILEKFEATDNVAGYIKRLIREDIAKSKE